MKSSCELTRPTFVLESCCNTGKCTRKASLGVSVAIRHSPEDRPPIYCQYRLSELLAPFYFCPLAKQRHTFFPPLAHANTVNPLVPVNSPWEPLLYCILFLSSRKGLLSSISQSHCVVTSTPNQFADTAKSTSRSRKISKRLPGQPPERILDFHELAISGTARSRRHIHTNLHTIKEYSVTFSSHGCSAVCIPNTEGDWHRGCCACL